VTGSRVLLELVVVLGTAAVVALVFQAVRLPAALGYVLAGLLIGPHVPVPLVASVSLVHTLSELGVILLMFSIGLELRVGTLGKVGGAAGLTAVIEVGGLVTIGYLVARALGWSSTEALFAGACVGISSTMLVVRNFEDLGLTGGFTRLVLAVLVFEDLLAILLLAILTGVATGHGLSAGALAETLARLGGFLVATLVGGLLVVPRLIRLIAKIGRPDTLTVAALAICFGMAALAEAVEYSVALGAFMGGMFVAESGKGHDVGLAVKPFRDVFAAIFFVSIGMTIQPEAILSEWPAILVFSGVVLIGKPIGVSLGAFLAGNGVVPAIRAGLSLAQIGELSFVMAGIGIASGVVPARLLPVFVGVACVTAFVSPLLVRRSEAIAARVAHGLPRRIATFVSLYDAWLGRLRARSNAGGAQSIGRRFRRAVIVLAVDAFALAAVMIGGVTAARPFERWLAGHGISPEVARPVWIAGHVALGVMFLTAVIRRSAQLAHRLALEVIPRPTELDLGRAPRRALIVTLEVAIALAVGIPLAAVTQPFVSGGAFIVLGALVLLVVAARRSIADLDGHVRAGSELVIEVLGRQTTPDQPLPDVEAVMPGMSGLAAVTLTPDAFAVGKSLADLDLRARTGATVLAIRRGEAGMPAPSPKEPLHAGDVLALTGSDDDVAAARALLLAVTPPSGTPAP
jgi:CPA2 family monovalent cation:H+ antiporter-2